MGKYYIVYIAICLICSTSVARAGELRSIVPILKPYASGAITNTSEKPLKPVARKKVANAVKQVIDAWNQNQLGDVLDDSFYDRSRLVDAMATDVPRDARLETLSIGDVQTLNSEVVDTPEGRMSRSTVMVSVKTQLTFNDSSKGYQRREGTNTYILTITEPAEDEGEH